MATMMVYPALLLAASLIPGQRAESGEPIVQVGVFNYHADGTPAGSAFGSSPRLESTVYTSASLCQLGAGSMELPAMAAHAWRFSGKVVSVTPESAVVQLEWSRVMENGNPVTQAATSVQLTLRAGEQVVLDSASPQPTRNCSVATANFEARYTPRTWWSSPGSARGGGTGRSAASGAASGGAAGGGGGFASARAGARGAGQGAVNDPDLLKVELWLVHSAPNVEEQTFYQTLRVSREGAMFAFAPLSISTPEGPVSVQITGSFSTTTEPRGPRLIFMTQRRVSFGPVRGASTDEQGTSRVSNPMPGPDEVLLFELPPIEALKGRPAVPDQFAVRVRIRPVGAGE